ncbi:L-rhamnose mutarotase [Leifsonia sp. NPDC014704]|uniref:L-rhamnose mutarotase n=1 Tax=Leifsonia sp. NPDC014704 TaxID=3364123 RepID=UPI0036F48AE2
MSERICFQLQLVPELIEEYRHRHARVPQEMLDEIARSGRRNYSIFLGNDGLLIGYFETDDLQASTDYLASSTIATAWEADSARYFIGMDERPDQGFIRLIEVFNLASQRMDNSDDE